MSVSQIDNIIRTLSIISSKYAPPDSQIYNTTYLVKISSLVDNSDEKVNTIISIARSGVNECMRALNIEYKAVAHIYIKSLRRLFNDLLSSI